MFKKAFILTLCLLLALGSVGCSKTPGTEPSDPTPYKTMATQAVADLLSHWWVGTARSGHLLPTISGYHRTDHPGQIWNTAMLIFPIYDLWFLTGDDQYRQLLLAEAQWFKEYYTLEDLEIAGEGPSHPWSDDCAWSALAYLTLYNVTEDSWFLDRAINLLDSVMDRWYNEEKDFLYYRDDVDVMSYYESGMALAWLRIWEITGEQRFYDLSLASYNRVQKNLGRDDGLYYCEATVYWATGNKDAIGEAGSSSALAGNMCMAALSAKFYKITGDQTYLDRVYLTNQGLLKYYDKDGVLLNDRDAWTNATFAGIYVSEVLSLPDTAEMQALIFGTAHSIFRNARTDDGYYGGSWQGPAEGPTSIWYLKGSVPQQSITSGTSIMMITAAALLEAGITDLNR